MDLLGCQRTRALLTSELSSMMLSKMVAPNDSREDDDDVGALIYRESQLRKAEAEAVAAESKKTSSASTHHRTSLGREHLSTTRAKNHCIMYNAEVPRRGHERLHWRMIGPRRRWPERSIDMNALLMDAQTKSFKEECAFGMGQRSSTNDAATKDVQTFLSKEECASSMVLRLR